MSLRNERLDAFTYGAVLSAAGRQEGYQGHSLGSSELSVKTGFAMCASYPFVGHIVQHIS